MSLPIIPVAAKVITSSHGSKPQTKIAADSFMSGDADAGSPVGTLAPVQMLNVLLALKNSSVL